MRRYPVVLFALSLVVGALVIGQPTTVYAQASGSVEITGGEGVVSVVSAPGGISTNGGGASTGGPPQASVWPYTCTFYVGASLDSLAVTTTTPSSGSYYNLVCNPRPGATVAPILEPVYLYNPAGPLIAAEPDLVTSLQVRDAAQNVINPPDLGVGVSPEAQQITGLETWLWPDGDTAPQYVSATAGGLTVTIEAQLVQTEFVLTGANQETVTCTSFVEWSPGASESPCSVTMFEQSSAQSIEARSTWRLVWWDNAGQPAPVELGFITEVQVDVVEVVDLEAVITR